MVSAPAGLREILPVIIDRIVRQFDPDRIILFGSHARGEAGPWSDIDLLVVLPACQDKRASTVAVLDALSDLPVFKDVVVTTPGEIAHRGSMPGGVLKAALAEGRVVYERA